MELIIMRTSLCALEIPKGLSKVEVAGGGGGEGGVGIFCPMVRLSHEEFNLVPERTFGMKNENKGLRITYFINFLASSQIMQISYEAL